MRLIVLILLTAVVGCANSPQDECGGKVLLLWPTAAGEFKFQEIQLSTLKSPYELKGAAAEIYYDSRMTDKGYEGPVARPDLTRSHGTCVPKDVGSSMALTTYAHFERLYFFDRKLNVQDQISWPRKVGVEIRLRGGEGISHTNAHYFGINDSMAVVPYSQKGLPLSMNAGILGHEHFHAHFQSQVLTPLNYALNKVMSVEELFYGGFGIKPVEGDLMSPYQRPDLLNKFILRSWNEGLADFYGSVFTQQAEFFSVSISTLGQMRNLGGSLQAFKGSEDFVRQAGNVTPVQRNFVGTSYQQGTLLARLMYQVADSGSVAPEELLQLVLQRLNRIPTFAAPTFTKRVMNFEDVVPLLLEGVQLNESGCIAIRSAVSKDLLLRRFPKCVQ